MRSTKILTFLEGNSHGRTPWGRFTHRRNNTHMLLFITHFATYWQQCEFMKLPHTRFLTHPDPLGRISVMATSNHSQFGVHRLHQYISLVTKFCCNQFVDQCKCKVFMGLLPFTLMWYAKRYLSGWSNVEQWKIFKSVALAVIELR